MKRTAQLNLTVNGVTYHGAGETIAQAAAALERAVHERESAAGQATTPAPAPVRYRVTPAGEAYLAGYREGRR